MQHADDSVTPSPAVEGAAPAGTAAAAAPTDADASPSTAAAAGDAVQPAPAVVRQRIHSGPNFVRFALTGIVLGFAIGGFLAFRGQSVSNYDNSAGIGYMSLVGACLGAVLACLLAVLVDWVAQRRDAPKAAGRR